MVFILSLVHLNKLENSLKINCSNIAWLMMEIFSNWHVLLGLHRFRLIHISACFSVNHTPAFPTWILNQAISALPSFLPLALQRVLDFLQQSFKKSPWLCWYSFSHLLSGWPVCLARAASNLLIWMSTCSSQPPSVFTTSGQPSALQCCWGAQWATGACLGRSIFRMMASFATPIRFSLVASSPCLADRRASSEAERWLVFFKKI